MSARFTAGALRKLILNQTGTGALLKKRGMVGMPKIPKPIGTADDAVSFTIKGDPMGAPRQTRRDTWRPRACVLRYRAWKDDARAASPANLPTSPVSVSIIAYLPIPDSWSARKKADMGGKLHQSKPDWDNIAKGVCDALWEQDSCIAIGSTTKRWDDGKGPRIEITVY